MSGGAVPSKKTKTEQFHQEWEADFLSQCHIRSAFV